MFSLYSTPTVAQDTKTLDTTWTIKNPCIDPAFVTISEVSLELLDYIIDDDQEFFVPTHADF